MNTRRRDDPRGFTLLELLVVILIVVLVSAATLPAVIPAIAHRQVSESARILQATIAGARDAAIRANAPRGIRLLPDPAFPGPGLLAANRMISIEAAPDYTSGRVKIEIYNYPLPSSVTLPNGQVITQINPLIISEAAFDLSTPPLPNEPTSWYWNIRQGDKIRFDDSGRYYTIAGPNLAGVYPNNVERYINYGPTGNVYAPTAGPISANGTSVANNPNPLATSGRYPEFLIVMNGQDDNGNGWVDEAFDGIDNDGDGFIDPAFDGVDNNGNGVIDDLAELVWALPGYAGEYEEEKFIGNQFAFLINNPIGNVPYTIFRRPVVSEGAREVALPEGVVIDMTTWNAAAAVDFSGKPVFGAVPERSRLPVDPFTLYVDIMLSPNGQVLTGGPGQSTLGSTPTANVPFYHFWLAEREDVVDTIWTNNNGSPNTGPPFAFPYANPQHNAAPPNQYRYMLPMPKGSVNYNPQAINPSLPTELFLKGDRRLVTLFVRSGLVVTNEAETFDGGDVNTPFYGPQVGTRQSQ